jgi:hypothetical protein
MLSHLAHISISLPLLLLHISLFGLLKVSENHPLQHPIITQHPHFRLLFPPIHLLFLRKRPRKREKNKRIKIKRKKKKMGQVKKKMR